MPELTGRSMGCCTEPGAFASGHVVVEELPDGETLRERLAQSPCGLDADEAISIADAMLSGLECAARQGVVHRDVRPGNVFLCRDGGVKLAGFEPTDGESQGGVSSHGGGTWRTYDYCPPDFRDDNFGGDVLSDIYSVGVVLHEMLCGRLPYPRVAGASRQSRQAFLSRWECVAEGKSPVCVDVRIGRLLVRADEVLAKALAICRKDRYGSFSEFRSDLRSIRFRELGHDGRTYRLLRFVGKGGFGEVYKARHCESGREVAIKRLLTMDYASRFYREARIMQQLRDDCFVHFFDFFVRGSGIASEAFLVMDYLDGMPGNSLRDAIKASKAGGLPQRDVFVAFSRYAHGLAVMHRKGLFHRDIKPSNLYYPRGNPSRAAIMDLGVARDENGQVTQGMVPGTLDYMPPEVMVSNSRGDERMDIYALGLCLYEALTGKLAYPRLSSGFAGMRELVERSKTRRPPDFSHPPVSQNLRLRQLLLEMTDPDEKRRLCDAEALASRLAAFCGDNATCPKTSAVTDRSRTDSLRPVMTLGESSGTGKSSSARRSEDRSGRAARPLDMSRVVWQHVLRRILACGAVAIALVMLIAAGWLACPSVRAWFALRQLASVCAKYRAGDWDDGVRAEQSWMARWRSQGNSWFSLPFHTLEDCLDRLKAVKAETQLRVAEEERRSEQSRERKACVERLNACRRIDGRLDESRYRSMSEWSLPERLNGDAEIGRIVSGLGRIVAAAVRVKLELEPLESRRARIHAAKELTSNPWTERVMESGELKRLKANIEKADASVAGMVGNLCDEPIFVDGVEIAPGGTHCLVVQAGEEPTVSIVRDGYRPIGLPSKFDGTVFQVRSTMFVSMPRRVQVPDLGNGITCKVDGVLSADGMVELLPGPHVCVYSRDGYEDQRSRFAVRVNAPVEFPAVSEWRPERQSQTDVPRQTERAMSYKDEGTSECGNCDSEELDPRAMLRRSVQRRCAAKLSDEPVETRQERLGEAGVILTRAVAIDHTLTEEEAKPLYAAIESRRKWVVGKVVNETPDEINVGGRKVAGGQTALLRFENGLPDPDKWVVERAGYLPKPLMRDFDGLVLRFRDEDFVGHNVLIHVPEVAPDILFVLGGETRPERFYLKPGYYTGFYRRNGFRDQVISFEVPVGVESFNLAAPTEDQWKSW